MISGTVTLQASDDSFGNPGIGKAGGTDGHEGRPGPEVLPGIGRGRHAAHPNDRHAPGPFEHAMHGTDADCQERRAAHPTGAVTEAGRPVIVCQAARHRVHDGDPIGAGVARDQGHGADVGKHGRQLGDEGALRARAAPG